jgi:hypothetical protein
MTSERVLDLHSAFRSYGYVMTAEPIPGQEDLFCAAMREGLARIEARMKANARAYGFRGRSEGALAALHARLPEPAWGVEVSV